MRRRPLIVANWKMNGIIETARELADEVRKGLVRMEKRRVLPEVVLCPPFTALFALHQEFREVAYTLGAQNMSAQLPGPCTGEISGVMLRNVGCRYVILGHSERRRDQGESDLLVAHKVVAAFRDGLLPIVCVGEDLAQRDAGITLEVVGAQLNVVLDNFPDNLTKRQQIVVAYEPVWAIGTGRTASAEQAQEVHSFLRARLASRLGETAANKIRILYGGSVKADNAAELMAQPDVDGGLVGGASLNVKEFLDIVDAAPA